MKSAELFCRDRSEANGSHCSVANAISMYCTLQLAIANWCAGHTEWSLASGVLYPIVGILWQLLRSADLEEGAQKGELYSRDGVRWGGWMDIYILAFSAGID